MYVGYVYTRIYGLLWFHIIRRFSFWFHINNGFFFLFGIFWCRLCWCEWCCICICVGLIIISLFTLPLILELFCSYRIFILFSTRLQKFLVCSMARISILLMIIDGSDGVFLKISISGEIFERFQSCKGFCIGYFQNYFGNIRDFHEILGNFGNLYKNHRNQSLKCYNHWFRGTKTATAKKIFLKK